MKKAFHFYFLIVVMVIAPMTTPQTLHAGNVCASNLIYCNQGQCRAAAEALCVPACQKAGQTWNGNWNNTDPNCHWFWSGQYAVCGCNPGPPCQCKDGHQIACNESNNPSGPGKCKTDCDCAEGRFCDEDGWCYDRNKCSLYCRYNEYCDKDGACREDPNCCNKSLQIFTQCTLGCGTSWTCNSQCELMYKAHASTCNNGKGGCAPAPSSKNKEEKSQQKKQGISPSKPPLPPKEKKASDEKLHVFPKPKESPTETPSKALKPKEESSNPLPGEPKVKDTPKEKRSETPKDKEKDIQDHNLNPPDQTDSLETTTKEEEYKENE